MRRRSLSLTGATGFVGSHVGEAFMRAGWTVRAVVRRGNRKLLPRGLEIVESDLSVGSLTEVFAGSDLVIHGAALIRAKDEASFNAVNVKGSRAAAVAAAAAGARFLLISSQAAGGQGTPDAPRCESDVAAPVNAYGRSKLAAEAAVRAMPGLQWTILRPCAVYGPRDRGFLPLFALGERGIFLVPSREQAAFSLVHIDDLTRAVLLVADSDRAVGETLFVGHPQPKTGTEVLRAIADGAGRPFRPLRVPAAAFTAAAWLGDLSWKLGVKPLVDSGRLVELRARGFVCSVQRIRDVLGFEATKGLDEGIAETRRWYRENGWI
jgi:nucleoside-diphosphate-sugar epimerase